MPFTGRGKVFGVLEYARSELNNTVHHAFVREFSKQSPTAMQIWTWNKKFTEEGCLCRRKGSGRPKTAEETVEHVCKKSLTKPKEIVTKNMSGNPDSSYNSFRP